MVQADVQLLGVSPSRRTDAAEQPNGLKSAAVHADPIHDGFGAGLSARNSLWPIECTAAALTDRTAVQGARRARIEAQRQSVR